MAAFLNAITSDIVNRFITFLIDKSSKVITPTTESTKLHDLQQLLLRVRIIVEEAEGRHITNPVMVCQLNILRKEMYRGYFTLDSLRSQGNEENKPKDHDVSHYFALSKFSRAKRLIVSTGDTNREKDLEQILHNLKIIMVDMSEFIKFLNNYPPLFQQPYSMYLYVGKCMFGRQMEVDRVMSFLMLEPPSMKNVGVLPIVGPTNVGKRTLVAHLCNDERVRNHFSQIVTITGDEINEESLTTLKDGGMITCQDNNCANDRLLIVVELSRDIDEVVWNRWYSSACDFLRGSKIIVTSRSDTIIKFGTTQALVLNFLPVEAYWYFFKILTFGSVDSNDHPKLKSMAMDMARWMNGSFIAANINSDVLGKNLISQYWWMHFARMKKIIQRNVCLYGESPYVLSHKNKLASYPTTKKDEFLLFSRPRACLPKDIVPTITMHDVVSRSVKCEGKVDVLVWKSHILPYKPYIATCTIDRSHN